MLMFKKRIQLIIGLPQPKESEIQKELQIRLARRTYVKWVCIDSEDIFSSQRARELFQFHAVQGDGTRFLDDLRIAGRFAFDNLLRSVSDQGVPVVGFDRFQLWKDSCDSFFSIDKTAGRDSLFKKNRDEVFAGYNFSLAYVLLKGEHIDEEFEHSMRQMAEKDAASLIEYDSTQGDDLLLDQLVDLIVV